MPIPSIKVVGRLGVTVIDGVDLDDEPDIGYCDEGKVVLTPIITHAQFAGDVPMASLLGQDQIEGTIDSEGYITWAGRRYIKVFDLTSEQLNPHVSSGKATHHVEFKSVKRNGVLVTFPGKQAVRIAGDTAVNGECNLVTLMPVPVGGGTAVVMGPPGPPGDPELTDEVTATNLATGPRTRAALEAATSDLAPILHTHNKADFPTFVEDVQDAVAQLLQGASGVTLSYNDTANTLTITGGGAAGLDAEAVRDAIGVALVGTGPIQIVVNDAAGTITFQLNGLIPIANAPAGMTVTIKETAPGTYPVRGTARIDITVMWVGGQAPIKGGNYMADHDLWLKAATA